VGVEVIIAGVVVGILVGATGMGAGSLMAPLLITVFNVPALSVVGTDLLYSGASKAVGAWRHRAAVAVAGTAEGSDLHCPVFQLYLSR
jgi:uncharacterized membrane protein YfcA